MNVWWSEQDDVLNNVGAARDLCSAMSARLSDPDCVRQALDSYGNSTQLGKSLRWAKGSLGFGNLGIALALFETSMFLEDEQLFQNAHTIFRDELRSFSGSSPDIGLFGGMSGVLLTAKTLSQETSYSGLILDVTNYIVGRLAKICEELSSQTDAIKPLEFDMMGGLVGVAVALSTCASDEPAKQGLRLCVETLEKLCLDAPTFSKFLTKPADWPDSGLAKQFPDGYLNLGVAHGLPGVLGALAIATKVATKETTKIIGQLSDFILKNSVEDSYGPNWPAAIGPPNGKAAEPKATRAAWCYGSPGVSIALFNAAEALGDEQLKQFAVDAMEAVFRRPRDRLSVYSPTVCHGKAGLAIMAAGLAAKSGSEFLSQNVNGLIGEILAARDDSFPLCVRDEESPGKLVDNPGFLEGAPGVLASLACLLGQEQPFWLRIFFLGL